MEDYLEHYGVQGQKWGIRRFQNKDGTLTKLGKKRYGSEKMQAYKENEINRYSKALNKAIKKGDLKKANKSARQLTALKRMSEKDIRNEALGIYQNVTKSSIQRRALGATVAGLSVASPAAAPFVVPISLAVSFADRLASIPLNMADTFSGRVKTFASDYKEKTMDQLEKFAKNI